MAARVPVPFFFALVLAGARGRAVGGGGERERQRVIYFLLWRELEGSMDARVSSTDLRGKRGPILGAIKNTERAESIEKAT